MAEPEILDESMTDEKPKTISVKLRTGTVETARIVSAYTGETITDLLSDILDPVLERMEKEEIAKRHKPHRPHKGKGEVKT